MIILSFKKSNRDCSKWEDWAGRIQNANLAMLMAVEVLWAKKCCRPSQGFSWSLWRE